MEFELYEILDFIEAAIEHECVIEEGACKKNCKYYPIRCKEIGSIFDEVREVAAICFKP